MELVDPEVIRDRLGRQGALMPAHCPELFSDKCPVPPYEILGTQ